MRTLEQKAASARNINDSTVWNDIKLEIQEMTLQYMNFKSIDDAALSAAAIKALNDFVFNIEHLYIETSARQHELDSVNNIKNFM